MSVIIKHTSYSPSSSYSPPASAESADTRTTRRWAEAMSWSGGRGSSGGLSDGGSAHAAVPSTIGLLDLFGFELSLEDMDTLTAASKPKATAGDCACP